MADDKSTVVVAEPAVFVAVIVNVVDEKSAAGVPEITPVEVENRRPVGRDGEMAHVATKPPVFVGVSERMAAAVAN